MKSTATKCALLVVCLSLVFGVGLQAQTDFSFTIDASCDDAELRGLIRSFFSRELRGIKDVRITTSEAPDYRIEVAALRIGRYGWTMSVVVSTPYGGADAELEGYARIIHHLLNEGDSTEDLGDDIGKIVRDLDREVLKPIRKERKGK